MKQVKVNFCYILIFIITACSSVEEGYIVKGKIVGDEECLKRGMIYMQIANTKGIIFDSAELNNGRFLFSGNLNTPEKLLLFVKELPFNIPLYLENEKYIITADSKSLRDAKIIGGESQEMFNMLKTKSGSVMAKYNLNMIMSEYLKQDSDSSRMSELDYIIKNANMEMDKFNDSLIAINPTSFYSLLNLYEISNVADFDKVLGRFKLFEESALYDNNNYFNAIKESIARREPLLSGQIAPYLKLHDIKGKSVDLKEIAKKNSLTVIVFWASWSKESVDFLKRVKKVSNKEVWKRVRILAVAVNDIKSNLEDVIEKEKFNWTHLIDNEDKDAMRIFNINLIPKYIVVDNNYTIVINDFRFEEIEEFLNLYFK